MGTGGCPWCAEDAANGAAYLMLTLVVADEPTELGVWCPTCALPSAVTFPVSARCEHGWPQATILATVTACQDCDKLVPRVEGA